MTVTFLGRLTPRARRDVIDGVVVEGRLRPRVARPVDGAANESLLRLLAAALDVPRGLVAPERGATSRVKRIRVDLPGETVRGRWPGLPTS